MVVTGAGRGIGQAIACTFTQRGWSVAVGDIDSRAAEQVAAEIGGWYSAVDVSDPQSATDFIGAAAEALGGIDVVVNNAGLIHVAPLLDHDVAAWRRVFAVNVEGPLNITQAVAPVMSAQPADADGCRGRVINIGSPAAEAPRPTLPAYGASKAALRHLSLSAAAALGPAGIWVVLVYPTNVEEGMWARLPSELARATGAPEDEVVASRLAETPSGRFQPASEVAEVVHYAATAQGVAGKLIWTEAHATEL